MRANLRWITVIAVLLGGWAAPPPARASNQDNIADREVGQPDFTSRVVNNGSLSATSLNTPIGVALDGRGNLYVADSNNNRVLEYNAPLTTTHQAAARVVGQPDFITNTANYNGVSATSLNGPNSVALDAAGNLYVTDQVNNRVLEYDAPLTTTAQAAARVFGQPNFSDNTSNNGGTGGKPTAASLNGPFSVALDAQGNLYVADGINNRVLEYDAPLTTHQAAARVLGQTDFTSNTVNSGGVGGNPTAASLYGPAAVALDAAGNLYVSDFGNNRVLEYDAPLTTHQAAARVFGQPDFTSNTVNNGGTAGNPTAASLGFPDGVSLDAAGNLYVADYNNNRVLEYDAPLTTHQAAARVFGQPDFTSRTSNYNGVSGNPTTASLFAPTTVALDAAGNLYVADFDNSRVLEYDVPVPHSPPALAAISPSSVAAGSSAFTLTVNGSGFVLGSTVRWNGSDRPTTFLNSKQLNALISGADVAGGGPFAVTVFTPAPGGGTSSLINLPSIPAAGTTSLPTRCRASPTLRPIAPITWSCHLPISSNTPAAWPSTASRGGCSWPIRTTTVC